MNRLYNSIWGMKVFLMKKKSDLILETRIWDTYKGFFSSEKDCCQATSIQKQTAIDKLIEIYSLKTVSSFIEEMQRQLSKEFLESKGFYAIDGTYGPRSYWVNEHTDPRKK